MPIETADDSVSKIIGSELRKVRKKHGYTLNSVSDALSITASVISRYEDGQRIPLESFLVLCEFYGVSASELIRNCENVDLLNTNTEVSQQPGRQDDDFKSELRKIVYSQRNLEQRVYEIATMLAKRINLEIITIFEHDWIDGSLNRIDLCNGEYISENCRKLTPEDEEDLIKKYKNYDSASQDTIYSGNKYITDHAWRALINSRNPSDTHSKTFLPSYHSLVVSGLTGPVNYFSYERHQKILGGHVKSTMYAVIDAIYPRFLLRVFNRSDIRNVSLSENQYQQLCQMCSYVSKCLSERYSLESLHTLASYSGFFNSTDPDVVGKLEILNDILISNDLPSFSYLLRKDDKLYFLILRNQSKFSNKLVKKIIAESDSKAELEANITPRVIDNGKHDRFIYFPLNETVVSSKSDFKQLKTKMINRGVAVVDCRSANLPLFQSYQDYKARIPALCENIEQYARLATGIVSHTEGQSEDD